MGLGNFLGEAVEQWGLISYNYAYFLYDNAEGSIYDKQKISTLIANKIALQWFANLSRRFSSSAYFDGVRHA